MASSSRDRAYWERRAEQYGPMAAGYLDPLQFEYEERLRWAAFRRIVPLTGTEMVLDAGCGIGAWSTRIADLGCTVTGVDLSATMIALAQPHERVNYVASAIEELTLAPESYDLAVCLTVLQHITEDVAFRGAIAALKRVLRPRGHAFVIEHSTFRARAEPDGERYMRYRPYDEWYAAFARAGFIIEAVAGVRFVDQRILEVAGAIENRVQRMMGRGDTMARRGLLRRAVSVIATVIDLTAARIPSTNSLSDLHAFYFRRNDP